MPLLFICPRLPIEYFYSSACVGTCSALRVSVSSSLSLTLVCPCPRTWASAPLFASCEMIRCRCSPPPCAPPQHQRCPSFCFFAGSCVERRVCPFLVSAPFVVYYVVCVCVCVFASSLIFLSSLCVPGIAYRLLSRPHMPPTRAHETHSRVLSCAFMYGRLCVSGPQRSNIALVPLPSALLQAPSITNSRGVAHRISSACLAFDRRHTNTRESMAYDRKKTPPHLPSLLPTRS